MVLSSPNLSRCSDSWQKIADCVFDSKIYEYGRIAVDREFVYIDFDDEWFPPCEGGEEVSEVLHGAYVGQKH